MSRLQLLLFSFLLLLFTQCRNNQQDNQQKPFNSSIIAAEIDTHKITDVDLQIKQEIYDELYRIFTIRKITLEQTINNYLITKEAERYKLSKDTFINRYYNHQINERSLQNFILNLHISFFPELTRTLKYYDLKTEKGKELAKDSFKKYLLDKFIDSLKRKHKIQIHIQQPLPPDISIEKIYAHYTGNTKSKITVLIVSDLECDKCREYEPIYQKLEKKYSDKVKFGFTHFASYVTLSAIAAECAAKQNKFWAMKDILFEQKQLPDSNKIFSLAEKLHLDINRFKSDFSDLQIQNTLEYNFRILKAIGLYATPTVLINGKPVFNSSSIDEIEKMINLEISK